LEDDTERVFLAKAVVAMGSKAMPPAAATAIRNLPGCRLALIIDSLQLDFEQLIMSARFAPLYTP
jgi:hypothetical protein